MMKNEVTPITINFDGKKIFKIKLSLDSFCRAQINNYIIVKDINTDGLYILRPVFHSSYIAEIYAVIDVEKGIFNIVNPPGLKKCVCR